MQFVLAFSGDIPLLLKNEIVLVKIYLPICLSNLNKICTIANLMQSRHLQLCTAGCKVGANLFFHDDDYRIIIRPRLTNQRPPFSILATYIPRAWITLSRTENHSVYFFIKLNNLQTCRIRVIK